MSAKKQLAKLRYEKKIEQILRVDHAGEYGAKRIYLGQLARFPEDDEIKHMMEQELEHLDYFEKKVKDKKIRPTMLYPIWHFGGFALGFLTACISREAAMACTVAVEEVIDSHYKEQLDDLKHSKNSEDIELSKKIEKFRQEEIEHRDTGLQQGAKNTSVYYGLTSMVKLITKTAIILSKRF